MAQSTLNLTTSELRNDIVRFCGFRTDGDYASASAAQQATVDRIIRNGLRRFYNPMLLPNETAPHEWSFLSPQATLALVAGTASYDLPDSFAGMLGPFTWDDSASSDPIEVVNDALFQRKRSAEPDATGDPVIAMIVPKATTGESPDLTPNVPTIFTVVFWPTPNADKTLVYRYYAAQDMVTATVAPPGGSQHAETMIAMCRWVAAEEYMRDTRDWDRFRIAAIERLHASVWADRRMSGRVRFGYNGDGSDRGATDPRSRVRVLFNGTQY